METYNIGEMMELSPERDIMEGFRDVAADLLAFVETEHQPSAPMPQGGMPLSQMASPAGGMSMPMMNQMMDPTMMPPEMLRPGQQPMGAQPNIQDPAQGQGMSMDNNPTMNNIGM